MALGLSRREQWTLIGVVGVILAGLGYNASQTPALAPAAGALVRNADGSAAPSLAGGPQPGAITTDATGRWQTLAVLPNHGGGGSVTALPNANLGTPPTNGAAGTAAPGATTQATANAAATTNSTPTAPFSTPLPRGLDLNRATEPELENLPGIGAVRAKDILALRQQMGGRFQSIEDLRKVKGIGPATFERLKPLVYVSGSGQAAASPPAAAPGTFGAGSNGAAPITFGVATVVPESASALPQTQPRASYVLAPPTRPARININRANEQELEQITGVGPVLAQRILQYRAQHGAIRSLADLEAVKGIGPATARKMAPQIGY